MSLARFFSSEPSIFSNEFRSLFNEIDRAFGSSWPGTTSLASSAFTDHQFVPRVRLSEEGEKYQVEAEVPGFPKESLNVQFQDNHTLLLSGRYEQETREEPKQQEQQPTEQSQEQQQQAGKTDQGNGEQASTTVSKSGNGQVSTNVQQPRVWRNERISQSFQRQIVFPTAVNQDAVEASLDHGILKLVVPKLAEEKHRKRITIA